MENITYPIRINRYLYLKGFCSRRQADQFIEKGLVFINGKKATLGQKVEKIDKVEVKTELKNLKKSFKYYLFNKPIGIVSHNPQGNEKSVEDIFQTPKKIFPIGRLDKDSEGLMLLTNDRRIVDRILNPKVEHQKEYEVTVDKDLKQSVINRMSRGVKIEGYMTKPAKVFQKGDRKFKITLTEGKKHQIRRMCAALGYQVKRLQRIRIIDLKLGSLPVGQGRELKFEERKSLLENIGLFK